MNHIKKTVEVLVEHGITHAFGVTGSGPSLELITELERRGVVYTPVAHEASAVLMAGAVSREGKTKAVAITIKGPGFANAISGILSNHYENRPALVVSEAFGPFFPNDRMHKRMDQKKSVETFVKGYSSVDIDGENVKALLEAAETEVPGPICLELYAVPGERATFEMMGSRYSSIQEIGESLKTQEFIKPAIVLGSLATRKLRHVDFSALKIPVVTTAAAKGAIDETSPYSAGVITGEIKELSPEEAILKHADLIIAFGLRNTEVVSARKFSAPLIAIDVVRDRFADGFDPQMYIVTEDISSLAKEIIALLAEKKWGQDIITQWKKTVVDELFSHPWMPAPLFTLIQAIIPDAALVLDTGLFCTVAETLWKAKTPSHFIGSSNGRFMGTSIPTAIGLSIANPEKEIVCVMGDGGIRPYLAEMRIAVEKNLPILFVLMSDEGYGSIASVGVLKNLSRNAFEIKESEWWRVVGAMDMRSARVDTLDEAVKMISMWKQNKTPMFIEAHFEPEAYRRMTEKLR